MKKLIFTLLSCMALSCAFSQSTYYYIGGPSAAFNGVAFNTALDGSGSNRTSPNTGDVIIFDGSNIGGATQTTGPVTLTTSSSTIGKLILQNGADLSLLRGGTGSTTTLTVGDGTGEDILVNAGCKLHIKGPLATLILVLGNNAASAATPATASSTGRILGDVSIEEGGALLNKLTSKLKGALVFASGSSFTTLSAYNSYPFGSTGAGLVPAAGGVVFEAGSSYYYQGGLSPFGSNSTSFLVDFQPGSNFYFRAPSAANMFSGRTYGNVFIETNITADGALNRINNFTINTGATFTTHVSGTTPVTGNIVNNGSFLEPAADPNRNNRIVMAGDAPQTIGGTGTFAFADFVISNTSDVTLLKNLQVDSTTNIFGTLRQTGSSALTGGGSVNIKSPASVVTSANLVLDSALIKNVTDFTGVEIGMGVTGSNIQPNTVVVNFSSSNGTITLSKPATATAAAVSLLVFNGAGVLPVTFTNERAVLNNNKTNISWRMETETDVASYSIERSATGIKFEEIGNINASRSNQYYYTDEKPLAGINYYRIKATGAAGQIKYSIILKVINGKGNAALQVYPNPVKNSIANVQISNLDKGTYSVTVFNQSGQKQFTKMIEHAGGSATFSIALPASVKAGIYILKLDGAAVSLKQQLIVQ